MQAKGMAVQPIPLFIKENYGDEEYENWLDALSFEAQKIFRNKISPFGWYPVEQAIIEPIEKMCAMYYDSDLRGSWACGMYSARHGLTGILKFFVKLGSPQFIIKQANRILPHYYTNCAMETISCDKKKAEIRITKFDIPHPVIDAAICGFIEEALTISGVKNVQITIVKSLARNDDYTQFDFSWD